MTVLSPNAPTAGREHPILCSASEVEALLADRQTQIWRLVWPQPPAWISAVDPDLRASATLIGMHPGRRCGHPKCACIGAARGGGPSMYTVRSPHGRRGDRLWVRETFQVTSNYHADCRDALPPFTDGRPILHHEDPDYPYWEQCYYAATEPCPELLSVDTDEIEQTWRPSVHMPRWASRLTLEITDERVARLHTMSETDAVAAGGSPLRRAGGASQSPGGVTALDVVRERWDARHNHCGVRWEDNPWVWVLAVRRVPLDAARVAA